MSPNDQQPQVEAFDCAYCKRSIEPKRITLKYILQDALAQMFSLERGLFYTIISVVTRPKQVVLEFISGNRLAFMNPFRLLFTIATASVIVASFTDYSLANFVQVDGQDAEEVARITNMVRENMNLILLANVPFFALGAWLVYRNPKWNYAEHLAVSAYAYSAMAAIDILIDLCFIPFPSQIVGVWNAISQVEIFIIGYIYTKVTGISTWAGILLFPLAIIMGFVIPVLLLAAILELYSLIF